MAAVFADNGTGVRGDLKAVVTAILLDPEARRGDDPAQAQPSDGKLKEPVLFITNLLRAMNGMSDGASLSDRASDMKQPPFFSPTVFNFYHPDHVIDGHQSVRSGIRDFQYQHRHLPNQFCEHPGLRIR